MNFPSYFRRDGSGLKVLQRASTTLLTGFSGALHAENACPQELFALTDVRE
jgi:hypothetical protein